MALHAAGRRRSVERPSSLFAYHVLVSVPTLGALAFVTAGRDWTADDLHLLFWVAIIAAAEMIPVPGWGGTTLTISLPLFMAVVLVFPPEVAAVVIFLGSWDPREFRREIAFTKALFNRSQAAISIAIAGGIFRNLASPESPWLTLLLAAMVATLAFEIANATLVAVALSLERKQPIRTIYRQLAGGSVWEFLFFYVGLGLLGVPLARLYLEIPYGEWAVVFFLFPLLLAQQMFSRTQALQEATSELEQREKVLRQLSSRMAEERYDERRQIATYLHDDLAQMLFRLGLQADTVRSQLEKGDEPKAISALDNVEQLKDDSVRLVRGLIRDLDHSPLGRAGLATALATLGSELSKESPTRFHVDVAELDLPAPIQLLAYQIAREAVQNAVKHAEPTNVWITLTAEGGEAVLRVQDDGAGFDTSLPSPEGHFGLSIMRERAQLAGGTLQMRSQAQEGTEVMVRFDSSWIRQAREQESENAVS
jgi:signal transduction histidine kinase